MEDSKIKKHADLAAMDADFKKQEAEYMKNKTDDEDVVCHNCGYTLIDEDYYYEVEGTIICEGCIDFYKRYKTEE